MRLAEELEARMRAEESLFRAQLLKEDAARLRRLAALAVEATDFAAFRDAGRRLGWTQGDARTAELHPVLDPFLERVYRCERLAPGDEAVEREVASAWRELTRERVEKLVGCLSNRVPKPGSGPAGA